MSGAFIVEGLTKVINLVGAFNPGNLGTYEVREIWASSPRSSV